MAADVHTLSGAYVLDSIEPRDRARFETHLADCSSCQVEVAALRETAVVLASMSVAQAPLRLRQRVLAVIRMTPQFRLLVAQPRRPAASARFSRLLAVAAGVAVLGGTGVAVLGRDAEPATGPITASTVLEAADAQIQEIELDGGEFQVAWSRGLGLMAVRSEMPELPPGRVYQLWVIADAARSLALLEDGQGITTAPDHGRLAVTVEPAGGSPQPTTVPVFVLNVSSLEV